MAQIGRFFDGPLYGSQDFAEFFTNFISTGFFMGLEVESTNTMNVALKAGSAFIEGYEYRNTDDLTLTVDTAHPTTNRIDRLVIRLDRTPDASAHLTAMIRKGTSEPPELVRNESIHEISLAQITVQAGKSFIEQHQIKDERGDKEVCGRVTEPGRITEQIDSIDVKGPDVRPGQYLEGTSNFYISGGSHPDLFQEWVDSIGFNPTDYRQGGITSLRAYVQTIGRRNNTGLQVFTLFAWDYQSNYRIYGEWKRANNAVSAGVEWGNWSENIFVVEQGENSNGEFIRYSDGTQKCWGRPFSLATTDPVGALYRSPNDIWTFPSSFASTPVVMGSLTTFDRWTTFGGTTETYASVTAMGIYQSSTGYSVRLQAWGRWR